MFNCTLTFFSICLISLFNHNCSARPVASSETSNDTTVTENGSEIHTVNIGLLIPEQGSESELSLAAVHGAELAVKQANSISGGYNQIPFKLIVRSCGGPWGVGSKKTVSLVYEDDVRAILASLDGRNAHLAEQVATKTRIAMLSARAGDPSLSKAFVPWYFRCISNDEQQAKALVKEIFTERKLGNIAVISDDGYDGKLASDIFIKQAELVGASRPAQILYRHLKPDFDKVLKQIENSGIRNIVLFGQPETSLRIIQEMNKRKMGLAVFGSLSVIGENKTLHDALNNYNNMVLISSGHWFTVKGLAFQKQFQKEYGYLPGAVAAHAYDGANLIIETIQKAGLDRQEIITYLTNIKYEGATGVIQFEDNGNRTGEPGLAEIRNGIPVPLDRRE